MMNEKYSLLISYLIALQSFAKDFHYYCKTFGLHLFMDEVADGLFDYTDSIRESVILSGGELPLSSKKYLEKAAELIPTIEDDDRGNLELLDSFLKRGAEIVEGIKGTTRGQNALLDDIAGHLDKMIGLTFLQLRKFNNISEGAEFKKEECEGCEETPVDRKEAKRAKIDGDEVAKTVRKYEDNNILVAEESTLDRLSKKLGLE